jgi:prepilin-type N-terminal cleavage/methylation domain-containing protein
VRKDDSGFSLLEVLIALFVLVFGLAAGAELIRLSASSGAFAGSQGNAVIVGESKMAALMRLYFQNPQGTDLSEGNHGPEEVEVVNPGTKGILNRFQVLWTVARISDPRPGKVLDAVDLRVTVVPVDIAGNRHLVAGMNTIVSLFGVFSPGYQ